MTPPAAGGHPAAAAAAVHQRPGAEPKGTRPRESEQGAVLTDAYGGGEEASLSPEALLAKLRRLDPDILEEHYFQHPTEGPNGRSGGGWDIHGMVEDLRLTQEVYSAESLEAALRPMREEMKQLAAERREKPGGAVEIVPGIIMLGDASSARNVEALQSFGVRRVVNCSPQTVRTGTEYYQSQLPGTKYMELWEDDLQDFCVLQDLDEVWTFATAGGLCLLHCEQGVNRSCALVVAMHMRLQGQHPNLPPEEVLRSSWHYVAERRSRALTNLSFQRQLLLFARLGLRWFPSVSNVWRTPYEQKMAKFRVLAEGVARDVVESWQDLPDVRRTRAVVYIRDGTMRCEMRMKPPFDLSSEAAAQKAERRIRSYAQQSQPRLSLDDIPEAVVVCGRGA